MRLYLLYIKDSGTSLRAYVTPNFRVDKLFWQGQHGGRLHLIGTSRSLALIFSLREQVNQYLSDRKIYRPVALWHQIKRVICTYLEGINRTYRDKLDQQPTSEYAGQDLPDRSMPMFHFEFIDDGAVRGEITESKGMLETKVRKVGKAENVKVMEVVSVAKAIQDIGNTETAKITENPEGIKQLAKQLLSVIAGRSLLWEELERLLQHDNRPQVDIASAVHWLVLGNEAEWLPAVQLEWRRSWWRDRLLLSCNRCGQVDLIEQTMCHTCGQWCAYCLGCLEMGRSKCCTPYICVPLQSQTGVPLKYSGRSTIGIGSPAQLVPTGRLLQWSGTFSPLQQAAAERARQFVKQDRSIRNALLTNTSTEGKLPTHNAFLIWAVCGAGKTELIFPAMDEALVGGGKVLIATPRKDVVLELLPRLQKVFPSLKVIAIHGSSEHKWEEADIVISTTHQVLRFYRRFALVIVDEVDAFPFHHNQALYRAVSRAVTTEGKIIYLSATPPDFLRRQLAGAGILSPFSPTHVLIPQRYHGHPIPVPRVVTDTKLRKKLAKGEVISALKNAAENSLRAGHQLFLFVPRVDEIDSTVTYMERLMPVCAGKISGVHAADPEREQKVADFRQKKYLLLVTTTILERGVTIPQSDVIVLGANAPVFDEASLVQIAGRVGRSADCPQGDVLFLAESGSKAMMAAINQIQAMNRLATKMRA